MEKQLIKSEIIRLNKLSREDEFKQKLNLDDFQLLVQSNLIEIIEDTIDFMPSAIIFASSKDNSLLESLSAYELYVKKPNQKTYGLLNHTYYREHMEEHPAYFEWIERERNKFLSTIVKLLYIQEELKIEAIDEWLNTDKQMADVEYKEYIQRMFPICGIPKNRDITKNLQTFFKDTLMHEFDHSCPICKINMEYMLIASHIRPFRDCAHIYEAFDNNNGLLLCKNHDALFDQGYISFDDEGKIIHAKALSHEERYQLVDVVLPKKYRTKNRMEYIRIHRDTIFQK